MKTINLIYNHKLLPFLILGNLLVLTLTINAQSDQWMHTNPGAGGAFNTVKVGPTGIVVACSDLSGAYISLNDGQDWTAIGASQDMDQTHASSVGFHTSDENIFCIGTEYGIYTTINKGLSFTKTLENGYIEDISFSSLDPSIVYATYHPQWNSSIGSIYKSLDSGQSWLEISTDIPNNRRILKVEASPFDSDLVYCLSGKADFACTAAKLFRSTNGGVNWTNISGPNIIMDFEISSEVENEIYMSTMNANCGAQYYWTDLAGELYKSIDYGDNWNMLSERTGVIWKEGNDLKLIDPREPFPWTGSAGTWQSSDDGNSWLQTGTVDDLETAYIDEHLWSYGVTDAGICKTLGESLVPGIRYWAHSRFVYGTEDGGVNFENKFSNSVLDDFWQSRGVDNVVMHDLEISSKNPDLIFAGYWDIGLWRSLDKGLSWQACNDAEFTGDWEGKGGNAMSILTDPDREDIVWATIKGDFGDDGFLIKSTDKGSPGSWSSSSNNLTLSPEMFSLALVPDSPEDNRTLFVSTKGDIYKSINDGADWQSSFVNGGIRTLTIDEENSNNIYAGGENGLFRSIDQGNSWAPIGLSEFSGSVSGAPYEYGWSGVTDICIDPYNNSRIYVSVLGDNKGIYKSEDAGDIWSKIYDNEFMWTIEASHNTIGKIYAGSSSAYSSGGLYPESKGLLLSEDAGDTWTEFNDALVFPFVTTIDISQEPNEYLFIGSPGTGFQYQFDIVSSTLEIEGSENILAIYDESSNSLIILSNHIQDNSRYSIFNISGKLVKTSKERLMNLSSLTDGIYIISVEGSSSGLTQTFVKY